MIVQEEKAAIPRLRKLIGIESPPGLIVALTKEAAEISDIRYVMEADREEAKKILG